LCGNCRLAEFIHFKSMAKVEITHVPYKGGGPAVVATVSGEINAINDSPVTVSRTRPARMPAHAQHVM
jgi:tripartite-type tricarboxylate transporter receptor subunit TctC